MNEKPDDVNSLTAAGAFDPDDRERVSGPAELFDLDRNAPTFATLYGPAHLERQRTQELVSLAKLPPWPGADPDGAGHGWGADLDRTLGGGVCPGYMLGIGADRAGAGKTAWAMQLADGLALRTLSVIEGTARGPLTPVMVLSEMGEAGLTWRSLARWTGVDARVFRAGASAANLISEETLEVLRPWEKARHALESEALGKARSFMRLFKTQESGPAAIDTLAHIVGQWRLELAEHGHAVWPVVVLDPIQRWQGRGQEVEALNELVERVGEVALRDGWVVLLTSDTNKPSSTGETKDKSAQEEGAAAFRGSYKLQHLLDAAVYLRPTEKYDPSVRVWPDLEAVIVKNRWGASWPWPRWKWDRVCGRFTPTSRPGEGGESMNLGAPRKRRKTGQHEPLATDDDGIPTENDEKLVAFTGPQP